MALSSEQLAEKHVALIFSTNKQVAIKPIKIDRIESADTGAGFMKNVSRGNVQEVELVMCVELEGRNGYLRAGKDKVLVKTEVLSALSSSNISRLGDKEFYLIHQDKIVGYVLG